MKASFLFISLFVLASCGSDDATEKEANSQISLETEEKLEKVQDDNVALETLDGRLDSLINELE